MRIELLRIIDKVLLRLVVYALGVFRRPRSLETVKRVAVIRLWAMGESILTLPMIKALKARYPMAHLTVVCSPGNRDVFEGLPFVDERCIVRETHPFAVLGLRAKFDLAIDTEPHFNSSALLAWWLAKRSIGFSHDARGRMYDATVAYNDNQHAVQTFCDLLKPLGIREMPKTLVSLPCQPQSERTVVQRRPKGTLPLLIGMHPGTGKRAHWRAWPVERFIELANVLLEARPCTLLMTGSTDEQALAEKIKRRVRYPERLWDGTSLGFGELVCAIGKCRLFVSNDTGPMHIAAAQGVHTVGLFGPNTPVRFGPYPLEKNKSFYRPDHPPVINVHKAEFKTCDGQCMRNISVKEVATYILDYVRKTNKRILQLELLR